MDMADVVTCVVLFELLLVFVVTVSCVRKKNYSKTLSQPCNCRFCALTQKSNKPLHRN
jgi:hypothetical protein